MELHDNIKQLRELNNWSQEEMAQKINMSKNGYVKIERGLSKPNLDRLQQIADAFGMNVIELIESANKGFVCVINENGNLSNHTINQYNQHNSNQSLAYRIQNLEKEVELKDKLLNQKDNELSALKKLLAVYEKE